MVTDIIVEIDYAHMQLPEVPSTRPGAPFIAGALLETCSRNAEKRLGSEIDQFIVFFKLNIEY